MNQAKAVLCERGLLCRDKVGSEVGRGAEKKDYPNSKQEENGAPMLFKASEKPIGPQH